MALTADQARTNRIREGLAAVVDKIDAQHCAAIRAPVLLPVPTLSIASVGLVALPVQPRGAQKIFDESTQVPVGQDTKAILGHSGRDCHQVDIAGITVSPQWTKEIATLASDMGKEIGITNQAISVKLHKLLLYSIDGVVAASRDEGERGVIWSLVVEFPDESG